MLPWLFIAFYGYVAFIRNMVIFYFTRKGGDSDVLIPVITSGTYKIKNHSIPSWYVVSLLWWYAKRRYSNAPYRGIQKSR